MDKKSKLERLIELRKQRGSSRKPRYGTKKLSVGLVSCLLGFTLIISPADAKAAQVEEAITVVSDQAGEVVSTGDAESTEEASTEAKLSEVEVDHTSEGDKQPTNDITEQPEGQPLEEKQVENQLTEEKPAPTEGTASEEKTPVDENKVEETPIEKQSQADLFTAQTKEIQVEQGGQVNYNEAITNLPADASISPSGDINTDELGTHTIAVNINFADGSSKSVKVSVNVIAKENDSNQEGALEIGDQLTSGVALRAAAEQADPGFGETHINATIQMVGIGDKPFAYDELFGTNKPELILVDRTTKKRLNYSIDKDTSIITITDIDGQPIKMADIENRNVTLRYGITNLAAGKLVTANTGLIEGSETGQTSYKLELFQVRNTDIVVKTTDKNGKESTNPSTNDNQGKIKLTTGKSSKEVNVPDNTNPTEVVRPDLSNKDEINSGLSYEITNKENGFLVDKDGNKVYKPGEITPDPTGLNPTEINFTEKPLVTTPDDAGDDKDYAKVTFVVGDKGETPSETSKAVIKGVKHGGKISAPANPTGKKGYTFKEWSNGGVQDIYTADTRHEALFNVAAPTGQNITTALNSRPVAASAIANANDLPEGTTITWKSEPDVSSTGAKPATVTVSYPDGTSQDVEVTVTVKNSITATPIEDIAKTTKTETKAIKGKVKYVADDSLNFEEKKVDKAPEDGEKEITTVSQKGKDDVVTEKTIKEAKDGLTKVGNKKVTTKTNEDGSTTITTETYEVDPDTGELSNPQTTTKTTIPAGTIEDIAKTTKVTTEKVPGKVKYEADDSLDFEEKKEDKAPVDGEKEVTTVSEPGKADVVTEEVTKEPESGTTRVGNKKVETVKNDDGSTTETTTIYDVNPETGKLENPKTTTKTSMPAGTIEDIAKTTKVTKETVPGKIKYVADENVEYGQQEVETSPEDGEKKITTVSQKGQDDVVTKEVIKEAKDGITKVGNKKVETVKNEDGSTTETTTIYDVNPETGELSNPQTTTKTTKPATPIEDIAKTTKKTTETIKAEVKYEADDSLDFEEKVVDKAPVDGEKEVTTVSQPGEKDKVTEEVTKEPEDGTTRVGNKKVETTTNEDGSTTETTTIYDVDPKTGELTNPKTTTVTTPAEEYLAIFNGNGGTPTTQKVTVKDGEVITGITEPTREGYKFVKWVKLGTDNAFDISTPFSKDLVTSDNAVIFTAVWEKNVSENGGLAIFYPKETHPIFKKVGDELTEEEITNAIVVLGLDKSKYTVTINEGQDVPTTDKPSEYVIDVTINFEDGTTDDAQVIIIITDKKGTTAEEIDPTIPEKTDVGDKDNLTDKEKEEVKNKIEEANKDKFPEGTKVEVDDKGNVTITYPDGSTDTIPADKVVEQKEEVDKSELQKEVDKADTTKESDKYKNADPDKKDAYDQALEDAKKVLENKDATQEEVDKAKDALMAAEKALNGKATQEVDKSELQKEVDKADTTKESDKYKNADPDKKDAYDQALEDAKKVLENKDATQEEVDKAKDALIAAEKALNGKATKEVDTDKVNPTVPGKTDVVDKDNLTDTEKEEVKNKIEEANKDKFPEGTEVSVDDKGNATITYPDGSKDTIPADELVNEKSTGDNPGDNPGGTTDPIDPTDPTTPGDDQKPGDNQKPGDDQKPSEKTIADKVGPTVPGKIKVEDPSNLTKDEKDKVKASIEKANKDKFPQGTKVEIEKDGSATITYPDGSKDTIDAKDLVIESEKTTDEGKKPSNEEKKPESLEKDKEGTNDVDTNDGVQVSRREVSSVTSKEAGKNAKTGVVGVYNTLGALSMAAIALEASKKKKEEDDN